MRCRGSAHRIIRNAILISNIILLWFFSVFCGVFFSRNFQFYSISSIDISAMNYITIACKLAFHLIPVFLLWRIPSFDSWLFLPPLVFLRGGTIGLSASLVYHQYGNASWLVYGICFFTDIFTSALILLLVMKQTLSSVRLPNRTYLLVSLLIILVCVIDSLFVSNFCLYF